MAIYEASSLKGISLKTDTRVSRGEILLNPQSGKGMFHMDVFQLLCYC